MTACFLRLPTCYFALIIHLTSERCPERHDSEVRARNDGEGFRLEPNAPCNELLVQIVLHRKCAVTGYSQKLCILVVLSLLSSHPDIIYTISIRMVQLGLHGTFC